MNRKLRNGKVKRDYAGYAKLMFNKYDLFEQNDLRCMTGLVNQS